MPRQGRLTVYTGPMYAGKTSALIDHLAEQEDFLAVKPVIDDRYDDETIISHDGQAVNATVLPADEDGVHWLPQFVNAVDPAVVGIDEAQFFPVSLAATVHALTSHGYDVVVAGLDTDFRRSPFTPVPMLARTADTVDHLTADCTVCNSAAVYTQRLIDDQPAPYESPQIQVGGTETYESRCPVHHDVPGHPENND